VRRAEARRQELGVRRERAEGRKGEKGKGRIEETGVRR